MAPVSKKARSSSRTTRNSPTKAKTVDDSKETPTKAKRSPSKVSVSPSIKLRKDLVAPNSTSPPQVNGDLDETPTKRRRRSRETKKRKPLIDEDSTMNSAVFGDEFDEINATKKLKEEKRFNCPYCKQGFSRKYDMEKHSRKHTGDKPYQCGICGRRFVQVGSLAVHMRAHTGEMPYKCDTCDKGFAVKERLRLHQRTHTGERPYKCEFCDKSFARGGQLMVHRRTHTGDKPYICADPDCNLKFTSSGNLKTHMKLHVGSREFQCHLCDKAYPRADTLKRHILSFHENKRLYKCDVCNKSFKGHIRDHMRTHAEDREEKPFGCNQCKARFNQRSQLTVHMRVHTGERPYSCKICARSFSHSTALKLHLRMHTGEKPHVCKLCKKAFAQLPHLKKHMLCVHDTDKPYYCERCEIFFKIKIEYQDHVETKHPDEIPEDLVGIAMPPESDQGSIKDIQFIQIPVQTVELSDDGRQLMPMEKMRTLLALLLKKISTPGRLKKLGFGTRLIDEVLKESITASGRSPCNEEGLDIREILQNNIQILLDWTIPEEYMNYFRSESKRTEEILEELAA